MGWLRLVGSLKLQVSFAEFRLFYRALLQKRPIILRSLQIVATPYPISWKLPCGRGHDAVKNTTCVSFVCGRGYADIIRRACAMGYPIPWKIPCAKGHNAVQNTTCVSYVCGRGYEDNHTTTMCNRISYSVENTTCKSIRCSRAHTCLVPYMCARRYQDIDALVPYMCVEADAKIIMPASDGHFVQIFGRFADG